MISSQWCGAQNLLQKNVCIMCIYIYIYFYITVRLQQSAQWEEQIIGIKNDSLYIYIYIYIYIHYIYIYIIHTTS